MDPDQARITYLLRQVRLNRERYEHIPADLAELIQLGVPYSRINTETGIPQSTAHAWVRRHHAT